MQENDFIVSIFEHCYVDQMNQVNTLVLSNLIQSIERFGIGCATGQGTSTSIFEYCYVDHMNQVNTLALSNLIQSIIILSNLIQNNLI